LRSHTCLFLVDSSGIECRDCDRASETVIRRHRVFWFVRKLTRNIFKTLLSDSSPENLLPVPSKQSTKVFGACCGPMVGSMLSFFFLDHCDALSTFSIVSYADTPVLPRGYIQLRDDARKLRTV
jgi:hypothetical protein